MFFCLWFLLLLPSKKFHMKDHLIDLCTLSFKVLRKGPKSVNLGQGTFSGLSTQKGDLPRSSLHPSPKHTLPLPTFLQTLISSSSSQGWNTNEVVRENEHSLGLSGLRSLLPLTLYMSLGNSLVSLELYMMSLSSFRF